MTREILEVLQEVHKALLCINDHIIEKLNESLNSLVILVIILTVVAICCFEILS